MYKKYAEVFIGTFLLISDILFNVFVKFNSINCFFFWKYDHEICETDTLHIIQNNCQQQPHAPIRKNFNELLSNVNCYY